MKFLFLSLSILLLNACSFKDYKYTSTNILTIKTKKFKFSDLAYIRNTDKNLEVEFFIAGKVVKQIDINYLICIDNGCITKSKFNEEYLSKYYPDEILQNIFLGNKIFDGLNYYLTPIGFKQSIKNKNIDINYSVKNKNIYFKDIKNHILIKIKRI